MLIGVCTIEMYFEGIASLKEKRSIVKTLLARLHKEFNVSAAEVGHQDVWRSCEIGIVVATNEAAHASSLLSNILKWIAYNRPDLEIVKHAIEIVPFGTAE